MERFSTNLYHHSQPFWFYLPVALLALVPWTVFVVAAVVDAIRDWRFSVQQPPGVEDLRTYLTVWLLLPIAFFSLSQSKLPGYILPAIPAGTILLANFIWRREQEGEKPSEWMGLLHALLSAAMLVAALVVPFKLLKLALPRNVIIVAAALGGHCDSFAVAESANPGLPRVAIHYAGSGCHRICAGTERHGADRQPIAIGAPRGHGDSPERSRTNSRHCGL